MEPKKILTIQRVEEPPAKTNPERQHGGPQSGLPPPYLIGSELAPYLIVGMDFGANYCRVSTFSNGAAWPTRPHEFRALVEDALQFPTGQLVHSLKHCIAGNYMVKNGNQQWSATKTTSLFLNSVKRKVEQSAEKLLAKAVINVPSCFTHRQRETLINAAEMAEIAVLGLINEPTAVALDACFTNDLRNGKYLVISSGAYSFEASIIHVQNRLIEVKSARGSQALSGHAITLAIVEALVASYEVNDRSEVQVAVEKEKPSLDSKGFAQVWIGPYLINLNKADCEPCLSGHVNAMRGLIDGLLHDCHIQAKEIAGIILGGNATKLWLLNDLLNERFGPTQIHRGNASFGAAIYAALLVRQAKNWVVWDSIVNPVMVAQGTRIQDVVTANSPTPINGHVCIVPGEDGKVRATILQQATDVTSDLVHVASIEIVEELPVTDEGQNASVDLAVAVSADGTLSFSARHKALDVNLTVEVSESASECPILDLTPAAVATGEETTADSFEAGLVLERIGSRVFVQEVVEGSCAAQAGIKVYDEVLFVDGEHVAKFNNIATMLKSTCNATKKLMLATDGAEYEAELQCDVASDRHRLDKLKFAISDATISGDRRILIQSLLDYGNYCCAALDYEAGLKATIRAEAFACSELGKHDILYLRSISQLAIMNLAAVLTERENQGAVVAADKTVSDVDVSGEANQFLSKAVALVDEIIHLFEQHHERYGTHGARILYDLLVSLQQLRNETDLSQLTRELIRLVFEKFSRSSLPSPVWKRFELYLPDSGGEKAQPA